MHPTSGFAEGSDGLYGYPALSSDFFIGESDDWLIGYPIPTSRAGSLRKEPIESQNHDSALRGLSGVHTDEPFGSSFNTLEELVEGLKDCDLLLNIIAPRRGDGNAMTRSLAKTSNKARMSRVCNIRADSLRKESIESKNYDEILLIGSGKGVTSVRTINELKWKRKNLKTYNDLNKIFLKEIKRNKQYVF